MLTGRGARSLRAAAAALAVTALAAGCTEAAGHEASPPTHHRGHPGPIHARLLHGPPRPLRTPPVPHERPGRAVPILMYHVIGNVPPYAPFPELYVSAQTFRQQMRWLARSGFHPVTMDQVWRYWHGGALPVRPIVLTFDDGYSGDFSVAAPVLHRHGWPGVLDLLVANLHRHTWGLHISQVRQMAAWGWQIASHTLTHLDLTTLAPADLWREVHLSRAVLRRTFGQPVDVFCYPSGRFDAQVLADVRRAGYVAALSELTGQATIVDRYTLPRIAVDATTTLPELSAEITAASR